MRLLLILLLTLNLLQAKKIALLIGNNDYSFQPLSNPLHDVDGIYKTLIEIGFKKSDIKVLKNASKTEMESELANFSQRATSAEIALVYFSGHGMQVNNRNYMFPARTTATKPVDLFGLVDLDYFIQSASSAKYGIILVDACRNNPLVKYFQNGKHKGSVAKKGLGQVTPTVGQVVIGFATSAGDTADDGNGRMSPYAKALSVRLKEKDDIRNILGKVASDVSKKYNQNPIYRANLASSVYLDKYVNNFDNSTFEKLANFILWTFKENKKEIFINSVIADKKTMINFVKNNIPLEQQNEALAEIDKERLLLKDKVLKSWEDIYHYGRLVLDINWKKITKINISEIRGSDIYVTFNYGWKKYKIKLDDTIFMNGQFYLLDDMEWEGEIKEK